MSSLYAYLHIILLIFNNMIKNIGPDGDSAYFSARYWYHPYYRRLDHIFSVFFKNYKSLALKELINCVVVLLCIFY